ncbi:MAG: pyruvate flavodoxin/ferredoxin oxidoreductase, partial [Desulfuromonadales bacterium]|nr:pyruvate flavodoxin/ferredoxin oxidoreductase [Desulfuromonadales bacterium]
WAERLRTPVVVLSDKEVAMTTEVVDEEALARPPAFERAGFSGVPPFRPYGFEHPGQVPAFAPVGGEVKVTVTGSAHD